MRKNTILKVTAICLAAALSLSLLGGFGTFADAASMTESVYVNKSIEIAEGVRINVTTYDEDGNAETKQYIPQDADGNTVYPFITDGTTYLPVRAVAELFGATIDWNTFYSAVVIATPKTEDKTVTNPNPSAVDTSSVTAKYSTVTAVTGVNIYVDNELYTPTDANGNKVDVILIDGTTYLPVRAMTKIFLGSDTSDQISWDATSYTVTISSPASASASGDTDDEDSDWSKDSLLAALVTSAEKKFGTIINPFGLLDKVTQLNAMILNGAIDNSSLLTWMESLINKDGLIEVAEDWGDSNGLAIGSICQILGIGEGQLASTILEAMMSTFGSDALSAAQDFISLITSSFSSIFSGLSL